MRENVISRDLRQTDRYKASEGALPRDRRESRLLGLASNVLWSSRREHLRYWLINVWIAVLSADPLSTQILISLFNTLLSTRAPIAAHRSSLYRSNFEWSANGPSSEIADEKINGNLNGHPIESLKTREKLESIKYIAIANINWINLLITRNANDEDYVSRLHIELKSLKLISLQLI